ncbi:tripartite motif-containing protein 2-like [Haliotis asinina]|uniref:tripartite motif-containing protein 2-like n=1 Tax=Haliotis asinina TaxID=109174 RepID=UPI0035318A4F
MDKFPKCSVCMQQFCYQGPPPRLLPCLHAACDVCCSDSETETLECSYCHKEYDKGQKFPEDKVRAQEIFHLTVLHHPAQLLCTNRQDGGQAVVWCNSCEALFCENCQVAHSDMKITKGHKIQTIDQLANNGITVEDKDAVCSMHQRPVDFYDATCEALMCSKCKRDDHVGHDIQEIDEAFQSKQRELKNKYNELLFHQESLNESILQINSLGEKVDEKFHSLEMLKVHTMSELNSLIDQREKELDIDLKTCFEHIRQGTSERHQELETSQISLMTSLEYIEKALTLTPVEYLELQTIMMQSVDSCMSEHVSAMKQQEAVAAVKFSTQGLRSLKTDIASIGCFLTALGRKSQVLDQQDNQGSTRYETLMREIEVLKRSKHELEDRLLKTEKMWNDKLTAEEKKNDVAMTQLQTQKESSASLRKQVQKQQAQIDNFKTLAQKIGVRLTSDLTLVSSQYTSDEPLRLNCVPLKFDVLQANFNNVSVSDRYMINQPAKNPPSTHRKFNKYSGTCGSMTFPYVLPSKPVAPFWSHKRQGQIVSSHAQATCDPTDPYYFQVTVKITQRAKIETYIFEIGFSEPSIADTEKRMNFKWKRQDQCGLYVGFCPTHKQICTLIHGVFSCVDHPFRNEPGMSIMTYGVVYNPVRRRVIFIDVNKKKVLYSTSLEYTHLLPMFGIQQSNEFKVEMTLMEVTDWGIDAKLRSVIQQALTRD